MLGVPHMVVCVNKMDLIEWDQDRYEAIKSDFMEFAARLNVHDITFIPISALRGDNVVTRSENTWWYDGSPLLNHLESVYIGSDENFIGPPFPGPVRDPEPEPRRRGLPRLRRHRGERGAASGDEILVLPTGTTSPHRVDRHRRRRGGEAFPPWPS